LTLEKFFLTFLLSLSVSREKHKTERRFVVSNSHTTNSPFTYNSSLFPSLPFLPVRERTNERTHECV
jgi:hypothetical protein